jgi:hypothetical protein
LAIQQRVYARMGMKELKNQSKPQKAKFERLETCKEVPPAQQIDLSIGRLLEEFNQLAKQLQEEDVYVAAFQAQEGVIVRQEPSLQRPSIRWLEAKAV